MSNEVLVSGLESDFVSFKAPSGQWNTDLDAYLQSVSATFGFNLSPHKFSLQFIPTAFRGGSGQLPQIGTYTSYEVRQGSCSQGFCIVGDVVHADYQDSAGGTVIRVEIEDRRKNFLDQIKLSSEDLGDTLPSGLVSVGQMYRNTVGFDDVGGNISDSRVKEYRNLTELGCTYQQIYNTIEYANTQGDISFDVTRLPHPDVVAANTLNNLEPIRWKFNAAPLSQVISTILSDSSYDWYWGMKDDRIKVVNRKVTFDVNEDSLAIATLTPDHINFRFGSDVVNSPSQVTILGSHQEGILNSDLLSPLDGVDEPAGNIIFTPAWTTIKVSFIDAHGINRTYFPTDTELQLALKDIETWAYYKIYQTEAAPDGWNLSSDEGTVAAQHWSFQSRLDPLMPFSEFYNNPASGLRQIVNRVDLDHNWVLEWYSRIQNHANSHYGRTYALEGFSFDEADGEFKVIDAAWCNLENQRQNPAQPFEENYQIDETFSPVSPFVTQDFRIRAHCVLPSSTVYGVDGYQVPASFDSWNEDTQGATLDHYIPIDLKRVGQNVINPRSTENAFEDYPEGTIIAQLPLIAGNAIEEESVLLNLVTLFELGLARAQSGIADVLSPYRVIEAYEGLSGIAIPVQIRKRYGQDYPATWASGTGSGTRNSIVVSDSYAPWKYFPVNQKTSVDIMSERVSGAMDAQLINVDESRFAEISQVDWPIISFDGYANQNNVSGLFGRRDHGVTDLSVNVNGGVPQTKYSIKSFFAEFGKDAPLGERNFGILEGIIHPIDFTTVDVTQADRPDISLIPISTPTLPPVGPISLTKEVYAVTVTQVLNRGSASEPERYFSEMKDGTPKPGGALDPLAEFDLICRDGFFNVGDHGIYTVERLANGGRRRYYTGGTDLAVGAHVVGVTSVGASTVNITYRGFSITDIPPMSGISIGDITAGDQGKLVSDGTPRADNEGNVTGIRPDRPAPTGIWFDPAGGGGATSGGGATPVVISGITGFGTSGAIASVQEIMPSGSDGEYLPSGSLTTGVNIIPIPAYATSGDIGLLAENAAGVKFVYISRFGFRRFVG